MRPPSHVRASPGPLLTEPILICPALGGDTSENDEHIGLFGPLWMVPHRPFASLPLPSLALQSILPPLPLSLSPSSPYIWLPNIAPSLVSQANTVENDEVKDGEKLSEKIKVVNQS